MRLPTNNQYKRACGWLFSTCLSLVSIAIWRKLERGRVISGVVKEKAGSLVALWDVQNCQKILRTSTFESWDIWITCGHCGSSSQIYANYQKIGSLREWNESIELKPSIRLIRRYPCEPCIPNEESNQIRLERKLASGSVRHFPYTYIWLKIYLWQQYIVPNYCNCIFNFLAGSLETQASEWTPLSWKFLLSLRPWIRFITWAIWWVEKKAKKPREHYQGGAPHRFAWHLLF